jgi:hypothetical protein
MISNLIILLIVSIYSAFLTKFIDFCFNEGNIFDWYYLYIYNNFKDDNPKLFKLLGGCLFCFSTWVFIFNFVLFNIYYPLPIIFVFFGIGINYISMEIINKYLDE